jgi:hypothetical protein
MRSHANDFHDIRRAGRAYEASKRGITAFVGNDIRQLIDEIRHQCGEDQCFHIRCRPLSAPPYQGSARHRLAFFPIALRRTLHTMALFGGLARSASCG